MYNLAGAMLTVGDLDRSIHFYTETLGFRLGRSLPDRWTELTFANFALFLIQRRAGQAIEHGGGVTLVVPDVELMKAILEARGATFIGEVIDAEVLRVAICEDPDANPIYLVEERVDHPTLPISLIKGASV